MYGDYFQSDELTRTSGEKVASGYGETQHQIRREMTSRRPSCGPQDNEMVKRRKKMIVAWGARHSCVRHIDIAI